MKRFLARLFVCWWIGHTDDYQCQRCGGLQPEDPVVRGHMRDS